MDRDRYQEEARMVVMTCYVGIGIISLVFFGIYWCTCRRRGIPGVVLGIPNMMQPNAVVVPGQNVVGPSYVVVGSTATPVPASNPHPVALSGAYGAGPIYNPVMTQEPPPSYNQTCQERAEQVPLFK